MHQPWEVVERLRHYEFCSVVHPDDEPCRVAMDRHERTSDRCPDREPT